MKSPEPLPDREVEFAKQCALRLVRTMVGDLETFFVEDGVEPSSERYMARVSGAISVLAMSLGSLIGTKVPTSKNLHETIANATTIVQRAATERWENGKQLRAAAAAAAAAAKDGPTP